MEVRTAASPRDVKHYTTDRLREEFLIQNLFQADKINLVYSHIDRIITGAAVPVQEKLALTAGDELRAEYFLQRREMGLINIGGDGIVYKNFALGFAFKASSSALIFIPSCSIETPTSFAPYERNVLRQPTNAGSSVSTTSPSLTSAFVIRSAHCWPPDTMKSSLFSKSKPSFFLRYSFIVSRNGV